MRVTLTKFVVGVTTMGLVVAALPAICGMLIPSWRHSFPHLWFVAALLLALVAFVFCGVCFYRREFLAGLYSMVGGTAAFLLVYLLLRSQPIY